MGLSLREKATLLVPGWFSALNHEQPVRYHCMLLVSVQLSSGDDGKATLISPKSVAKRDCARRKTRLCQRRMNEGRARCGCQASDLLMKYYNGPSISL